MASQAAKKTAKSGAKVAQNGRPATSSPDGVLDVALLKRLSDLPGIPGREDQVRALVIETLTPLVDELTVDALGNVIATKRGQRQHGDRRVMLAAHMDEIGFIARHVDPAGHVWIQPLGGFDPRALMCQRVVIHTAEGPLRGVLNPAGKKYFIMAPDHTAVPKLEEFYVDLGLPAERVRERVRLGDPITLERTCAEVGECVTGKAMDDRAGVFVMIEALRRLGKHQATVIAVATVQEEVGTRGAATSAYGVQPDVAIALDVTPSFDVPSMTESEAVTRLGAGAAIKVFDSSHVPNYKLVEHLRQVAETNSIPHQLEILPRGGTDAGSMQRARAGAAATTLSIPTRYIHTVNEMVHRTDLAATADLLARYLEDAHTGDYRL
jgi:endoglucanase